MTITATATVIITTATADAAVMPEHAPASRGVFLPVERWPTSSPREKFTQHFSPAPGKGE